MARDACRTGPAGGARREDWGAVKAAAANRAVLGYRLGATACSSAASGQNLLCCRYAVRSFRRAFLALCRGGYPLCMGTYSPPRISALTLGSVELKRRSSSDHGWSSTYAVCSDRDSSRTWRTPPRRTGRAEGGISPLGELETRRQGAPAIQEEFAAR